MVCNHTHSQSKFIRESQRRYRRSSWERRFVSKLNCRGLYLLIVVSKIRSFDRQVNCIDEWMWIGTDVVLIFRMESGWWASSYVSCPDLMMTRSDFNFLRLRSWGIIYFGCKRVVFCVGTNILFWPILIRGAAAEWVDRKWCGWTGFVLEFLWLRIAVVSRQEGKSSYVRSSSIKSLSLSASLSFCLFCCPSLLCVSQNTWNPQNGPERLLMKIPKISNFSIFFTSIDQHDAIQRRHKSNSHSLSLSLSLTHTHTNNTHTTEWSNARQRRWSIYAYGNFCERSAIVSP